MQALKAEAKSLLNRLAGGAAIREIYADGADWRGSHPFNERQGPEAIAEVWAQLRKSLPDMERRDLILVAGESRTDARVPQWKPRNLVATMGHYQGTFAEDLLDIPATKGVVNLRFCEVHQVEEGKIAASFVLWDLLDLMRQAGVWPFAPSLGAEGMWLGPADGSGVNLLTTPAQRESEAMDSVLAMHAALLSFDGKSLDSMDHGRFWAPDFLWYGPAGIGTTRGMQGFRLHHQIPFLIGFPDRTGAGHYVRISDGNFAVTGGWPSVVATHTGEWLGLPPTGRRIEMRVMDFYHLEGDVIHENWVPIDVIHMAYQMGFDVFARLRHLRGNPQTDLPLG